MHQCSFCVSRLRNLLLTIYIDTIEHFTTFWRQLTLIYLIIFHLVVSLRQHRNILRLLQFLKKLFRNRTQVSIDLIMSQIYLFIYVIYGK